jgi:hypothetical protein
MAYRPQDLGVDENFDVFVDDTGDLATVVGKEQLEQSVALDIANVSERFIGESLTATNLGIIEEEIRQSLNRDEQVGRVISVTVEEYNADTNAVVASVATENNRDFILEVDLDT